MRTFWKSMVEDAAIESAVCAAMMSIFAGCAAETDTSDVATKQNELSVRTAGVWPDARIDVCWDPTSMASKYDDARWWIRDAVSSTFEAVSSIRFRGWGECAGSQAEGTGIRVVVFDGFGGQSTVGRQSSGQTRTSIGDCAGRAGPEACVRTLATHEFGHALGFGHEHERIDATSPCADPKNGSGYEVVGGSEDLDGFLNYCNALSNGGGRLSPTDVRGIRQYYGGDGWALDPNLFDADFYLALYPDLQAAFGDNEEEATIHWLAHGLPREGRRGNRAFDVQYYLNHYGDVANALGTVSQHRLMGGARHWLSFGIASEGRRGSREFDPQYYRSTYGDLDAAFGSDWPAYRAHYEWWGAQVEGRRASREFDVGYYLASYEDLRNAFGSDYDAALRHWLTFGIREGRRGAP